MESDESICCISIRVRRHCCTDEFYSQQERKACIAVGWAALPDLQNIVFVELLSFVRIYLYSKCHRYPTLPVAELQRHQAPVNAVAWAPHSSCHICSAGDDAQALIWDLSSMSHPLDQSLGAVPP